MIDPRTVMLAIPCYDGKVMSELAGMMLMAGRYFGAVSMPTECSHVSLVRNLIAGQFLACEEFEWLICVDSDTVFSMQDLQILLEPCDVTADYVDPESDAQDAAGRAPRPTRIVTALSESLRDLNVKTAGAADVLVCAEYSKKSDELEVCRFGMGFVRIHRSVFKTLEELKHDGGPTVEVRRDVLMRVREKVDTLSDDDTGEPYEWRRLVKELIDTAEDKAGQPRLWQVKHQGRLYTDFFPSGPILSQFVPHQAWMGEDFGFFTLCKLAGIIPRVETRTRLLHIGRKAYPYLGPQS